MADVSATALVEGFNETLRNHRRAAGLSQEELAERAGISPRSISAFESGNAVTPRRDTVALLARALGLVGEDREAFEATVLRQARLRPSARPDPMRPSTADRPHHNVARSLTSFVGREHELRELGLALTSAPLVTLVGTGGVGKTRLAQELARVHAVSYADGAWIVELAEVAESSLVAGAVATALGLRDFNARNSTDTLTDFLRPKQLLLVLDNCEHLVETCAGLVAQLLRACPHLHVLATSREPLAIDGEMAWFVQPLELPEPTLRQSADRLARLAAVRLFVERARAVDHTFHLTEDNSAAVARICSAVDGIPLGLELAAARTRLLTVGQLVDMLEHDTRILSGANREAAARHRTIRATIDWSHDLLGEGEQILLRRLSVFAGGWTLDMAEEVCSGAGIHRSDVLDLLAQLVDKSMVVVTAREAMARYRLLEPIRQYALERLETAGEASDYQARHAATLLRLPRSSEGEDFGPQELSALHRFEVEHANLRVALRWALNHHENDAALRAASALFRFWERRGHFQEGAAWLEEALASAGEAPSRYQGRALNALAFLCWQVGDVERAQPIAEQALAVNREIGNTLAVAWALGNLGMIAYFRDEPEVAIAWLDQSVLLGRQDGNRPFLSLALMFLGRSLLRLNGPSERRAAAVLQESLALAEKAESRYAIGHALMTLGDLNWQRGDVERAVGLWRRALVVRSQIADPRGIADSLERLAWGLAASEQAESAAWLLGAACAQHAFLRIELRHAEQVDHTEQLSMTRQRLGEAFDNAWSAGHASTVNEAVVAALKFTHGNPALEAGGFRAAAIDPAIAPIGWAIPDLWPERCYSRRGQGWRPVA